MDTETTISKNIRIAGDKAKYDAACKRLLSERIILAWIMKSCLWEYSNCSVADIAEKYIGGELQIAETPVAPGETNVPPVAESVGSEDASVTEGTVTYDIRFWAVAPVSGEHIRLLINIEAQNDFYPGYPLVKRGIYYCGRLISAQYGTGFTEAHYEKVRKVYSIWICMNPPKSRENSITCYHITEDNLVGEVKEKKENYDLLAAVIVCLGRPEGERYSGVLKLLNVLLSTEMTAKQKRQVLETGFQIQMTQTLESEVSLMCNLSKGIEEQALSRGMQAGMKEGMKEGILSSIRNLMESMGWSAEQAMSVLKVPEGECAQYEALLKKSGC